MPFNDDRKALKFSLLLALDPIVPKRGVNTLFQYEDIEQTGTQSAPLLHQTVAIGKLANGDCVIVYTFTR